MDTENIKLSYETLWKFIIRPPRDEYKERMLGSPVFKYKGRKYIRTDYEIMSSQGYMMKCSFVEPAKESRPSIEMPVVLYLHGNASSRIEGLNMTATLLSRNINLFVIDFPGCGLSEGEYISLGYHESDDVGNVIDFLEKLPGVGNIGIWGRSMGAATTLIYAHRDSRVKAICLDSPFADFSRLAKELTLNHINLPGFLVSGALSLVRGTVLSKNGLDIDKLKPIEFASKTFQPAIFIHAIHDELINVKHSIDIFNQYGGQEKSLKCCDKGGHNTKRTSMILNEIGEFFKKFLFQDNDGDILDDNNTVYNASYEVKEPQQKNSKENNKNNNEDYLRKNSMNDDEDPFNDKTIEKIEYLKRREQNEKKQISEMEYLLKSIREPELKMAVSKNNSKTENPKINKNHDNREKQAINKNDNINNNKTEKPKLNKNINNNINNNINKKPKKASINIDINVDYDKEKNNNEPDIQNSNINFNNWKNGKRTNPKNPNNF